MDVRLPRCPDCAWPLDPAGAAACPVCRLPLIGPEAAELWRVHAALAQLEGRRAVLLAGLRARRSAPAPRQGAASYGWPGTPREAAAPYGWAGTPRTDVPPPSVQNVLLVLGGLLITVAGLVFTLVNWGRLGIGGRTAVLAALTVLALAAHPLLRRRRLTATAETASAIGLALVLLDCYAARATGLAGLDRAETGAYWAAATALAAAGSAAYAWGTRSAVMPTAGLLVLQCTAPLTAAAAGVGLTGWATSLVLSAAFDLAAVTALRAPLARRAGERPAAALALVGRTAAAGWALLGGGLAATAALNATAYGPVLRACAPLVLLALLGLAAARPRDLLPYGPRLGSAVLAGLALTAATAATARLALPTSWVVLAYAVPAALLTTASTGRGAGVRAARPGADALVPASGGGPGKRPDAGGPAATSSGSPSVDAAASSTSTPSGGPAPSPATADPAAPSSDARAVPPDPREPAPSSSRTRTSGPPAAPATEEPATFSTSHPAVGPAVPPTAAASAADGATPSPTAPHPAAPRSDGSPASATARGAAAGPTRPPVAVPPGPRPHPLWAGLAAAGALVLAGAVLDVLPALLRALAEPLRHFLTSGDAVGVPFPGGWEVEPVVPTLAAVAAAALGAAAVLLGRTPAPAPVPESESVSGTEPATPHADAPAEARRVASPAQETGPHTPADARRRTAPTPTAGTAPTPPAEARLVLRCGAVLAAVTAIALAPVAAGLPYAAALAAAWLPGFAAAVRLVRCPGTGSATARLCTLVASGTLALVWSLPETGAALTVWGATAGLAAGLAAGLRTSSYGRVGAGAGAFAVLALGVEAARAGTAAGLPPHLAAFGVLGVGVATVPVAAVLRGAAAKEAEYAAYAVPATEQPRLGVTTGQPSYGETATTPETTTDRPPHAGPAGQSSYVRPAAGQPDPGVAIGQPPYGMPTEGSSHRVPATEQPRHRVPALEWAGHAVTAAALLMTVTHPNALSIALAIAGVAALGAALRAERRRAGVLTGAALLTASSWVRLGLAGVAEPEPYTVTVSAAVLLMGHLRRRRAPETGSWAAYGGGLAVTLLPSLGAAWGDTHWLRPLLLGLAALAVTLLGARHRLQAPLLTGGGVLVADALHELAPAIAQSLGLLPRWAPLAAAGLLLLFAGATYEQRLADGRRLRAAFRRLR
ncbi:SCO7613 C-terminal domain-containing membrane protein [Streptomyces sp.]|uniref:SCO7613 C-terminal domain-containing membrane protein n=1 Tax=Streptomyces sp. TaxID=1931 RepID=UPI002F425291